MRVWAVITAGGTGVRMGGGDAKQFLPLGGRAMILHSAETFVCSGVCGIAIVIRREQTERAKSIFANDSFFVNRQDMLFFSEGGETRRESVFSGLKKLNNFAKKDDIVLIHDAARPFVSCNDINKVTAAAKQYGAALLCAKITDTVKAAKTENSALFAEKTLDREKLFLAQTPQGFRFELILGLHKNAESENISVTDDAALAEHIGIHPEIVVADGQNFKITVKDDFERAEIFLEEHKRMKI
jgi:2-C-methyl-D-erythritol 4-phosphate cytidylyltransferase